MSISSLRNIVHRQQQRMMFLHTVSEIIGHEDPHYINNSWIPYSEMELRAWAEDIKHNYLETPKPLYVQYNNTMVSEEDSLFRDMAVEKSEEREDSYKDKEEDFTHNKQLITSEYDNGELISYLYNGLTDDEISKYYRILRSSFDRQKEYLVQLDKQLYDDQLREWRRKYISSRADAFACLRNLWGMLVKRRQNDPTVFPFGVIIDKMGTCGFGELDIEKVLKFLQDLRYVREYYSHGSIEKLLARQLLSFENPTPELITLAINCRMKDYGGPSLVLKADNTKMLEDGVSQSI